jgi:hypothetical protein
MDSALASTESEAALLDHADTNSRYLWAKVLVARRRCDEAEAKRAAFLAECA